MRLARFGKRLILIPLLALPGLAAFFIVWGLIEASSLGVTRVSFIHPDIPPAFDGLCIAFLSDFHFGPFLSRSRAEDIVAQTNRLAPDLILLGGDYTDADSASSTGFFKVLGGLRAPAGVLAVLGNDDYKGGEQFIKDQLTVNGITVLDNAARWLERAGARIKVGGVSDLGTWRYDLAPTLAGARDSDFIVLLVHQPDFLGVESDDRLDLAFAGHTHGGQVNLLDWSPFVPSSYGDRYRQGLFRIGRTALIVSRGLGTVRLPLRVGAPPEIVLVTLERGQGIIAE